MAEAVNGWVKKITGELYEDRPTTLTTFRIFPISTLNYKQDWILNVLETLLLLL